MLCYMKEAREKKYELESPLYEIQNQGSLSMTVEKNMGDLWSDDKID